MDDWALLYWDRDPVRLCGLRFEQVAMKHLERDLEETCSQLLEWDGWRRLKTDPVSRKEWAKGFGEPGMADDLYIRYLAGDMILSVPEMNAFLKAPAAEVLWIEWKRPGGKIRQQQKDWHTHERKLGALTLIAGIDFDATFDAFKAWYQASGLQRKRW